MKIVRAMLRVQALTENRKKTRVAFAVRGCHVTLPFEPKADPLQSGTRHFSQGKASKQKPCEAAGCQTRPISHKRINPLHEGVGSSLYPPDSGSRSCPLLLRDSPLGLRTSASRLLCRAHQQHLHKQIRRLAAQLEVAAESREARRCLMVPSWDERPVLDSRSCCGSTRKRQSDPIASRIPSAVGSRSSWQALLQVRGGKPVFCGALEDLANRDQRF